MKQNEQAWRKAISAILVSTAMVIGCGGTEGSSEENQAPKRLGTEGVQPPAELSDTTLARAAPTSAQPATGPDKPDGEALSFSKADSPTSTVRAVGDFDGDGKSDVLWQDNAGTTFMRFNLAGNQLAPAVCDPVGTYSARIMGVGDFNGDGRDDIVWRNMDTGAVSISLMNGVRATQWLSVGQSPLPLNVKLEGIGDFDGNGRADMLWRNVASGRAVMSYHGADGNVTQWPVVSNYIAPSTVALKVGDINGDGKSDIVWRNMGTGNVVISLMDGAASTWRSITATPISLNVALEAIGDFDGNGRADLLWRNKLSGRALMSYHNEQGLVTGWPVVSNYINPQSTSAVGAGDFDGDGKADIIWRNLSNGNSVMSLMNGNLPTWSTVNFTVCPRAVPHTGITGLQCYVDAGLGTLSDCAGTAAIAVSNQQDGNRRNINSMNYSAVGANPLTSCVMDTVTGLVWEGKTASGTRAGSNTYTNENNNNPNDAKTYITYVNSQNLCGFNDWRMPTVDELSGLVDFGQYTTGVPRIKSTWFPNTIPSWYWTSTGWIEEDYFAWYVNFDPDAFSITRAEFGRSSAGYVRLVRGGSTVRGQFTYTSIAYENDAANNVAVDAVTGLKWRRCPLGKTWNGSQCTGYATVTGQSSLLQTVRTKVGWRMPNIKELSSIVGRTQFNPALDEITFPGNYNIVNGYRTGWGFWSTTPYIGYSSHSMLIDFYSGQIGRTTRYYNGSGHYPTFMVRTE